MVTRDYIDFYLKFFLMKMYCTWSNIPKRYNFTYFTETRQMRRQKTKQNHPYNFHNLKLVPLGIELRNSNLPSACTMIRLPQSPDQQNYISTYSFQFCYFHTFLLTVYFYSLDCSQLFSNIQSQGYEQAPIHQRMILST